MFDDPPLAPLLDGLPASQRERVLRSARRVAYRDGERLFGAGEEADGCWIVQRGYVAVDTPIAGRGDVTVQTVGPGDVVGWSWLLPPRRWQFGARAVGDASTLRLDTTALQALADEDPVFGRELLLALFSTVVHRLQATRARLLDVYRNPADPAPADPAPADPAGRAL